MNDQDLDLLVRRSLDQAAATQPISSDLHQRSVSYGRRVVQRRRVTGLSATAVVAAAAVIAVSVGGGKDTGPSTPAPPTLTSVVTHVRALPAETLPSTGFWYVGLRAQVRGAPVVGAEWLGPDGTARVQLTGAEVDSPSSSGQVILPWSVLASLPAQPADLMARLRHSAMSVPLYPVTDEVVGLMETTGALLGEAPTSPALRAALIEGLGKTEGVRVAGTARDLAGNTGLALTHTVGAATYTVLVSPSTGRALQVDYTSPTQHDVTTFLHQAAVADDHTSPPGVSAPSLTPAASLTAPAPTAQSSLLDLASRVKSQSGTDQLTAPWWYERIITTSGGKTSTGEVWLSRNGPTRVLVDGKKATRAVLGYMGQDVGKAGSWDSDNRFPTDPTAIYAISKEEIVTSVGADAPATALAGDIADSLVHLLAQGEFTPAQRAGVLGALARTGGTLEESLGGRDQVGRTGLLFTPPQGGTSVGKTHLIDQQTGSLLETRAPGTTTTYVVQHGVPNAHALPADIPAVTAAGGHDPSLAFQAAVDQQTAGVAGAGQLSLPADVVGSFVKDHQARLPDGTELAIGHYSGAAVPVSFWLTGTGGDVLEDGLGDPVKGASGITEYVLHDAKHQPGAEPWQWVVVAGKAATTKVETGPSSAGPWTSQAVVNGLAVIPSQALRGAASQVRLFHGGASPYFTGHLAVLPTPR
jgi:hypothetical protein